MSGFTAKGRLNYGRRNISFLGEKCYYPCMNVPANRFIRVFLPKIAKIAAKASMNQFGFGFAGDVFFEATDCFFKGATPAVVRKELEEILQQPEKFAEEVDIAIADESPEVQAAAKLYFDQVPSAIRHGVLTYGGRDDLAKRTLSKDIPLLVASDLVAFIPQSMPKFKIGDKPVSGTDLELTAFIGKGGFGEVWLARHSNRPNATEVVLKFCIDAAPSMKSLQKEVELLDNLAKKGITHPQIVRLLYSHLETTNPNPCLEYEFVDGGDLEKYLERRGESWTPLELLRIMIRIVEPVAFAHKHEIVHRDLKPRNILISISQGSETFKITDFGIGGIVRRDHWRHSHASGIDEHTTLSRGTYTPLYASTQQQDGKHPTKQDDVFAIGVMWYQLLLNDLLRRAPSGKAWKVRLSANQVTTKMIDLLEHCMECEVEDRIECAEVLLDRLKEIERTSEVNPPPKKSLDWAEILEHSPDPVVVTNLDLLDKIIESGYPWRVRHKLTGMEMLLVPEGAFEMGMSAGDAIAQDDEKPLHPVTLSKAYYIGTTLVTQEQWGACASKASL